MSLYFNNDLASRLKSPSQKVRVLSESWVNDEIFCPSCGNKLIRLRNNNPVADFSCANCTEQYELKSKKGMIGTKLVDGAYSTAIERLKSDTNPNLFVLNYEESTLQVCNFFTIPKHLFIPEMLEKRTPLANNARRAGWIGCNILLSSVPRAGRIFYVKNRERIAREIILESWARISFLKTENNINDKRWIIDIMKCIDNLHKKEFTLSELYHFESELQFRHRKNLHIKAKIRQQLQVLRDNGYIDFLGKGRYKVR